MSKKYHVKTKHTPNRFSAVSKLSAIEADGCLGCLQCVKRDSCVYDVYQKREFLADEMVDTTDVLCVACMRCVQECKKNILFRVINPSFLAQGDAYWTPEIILSLIKQAETAEIPVSGAGYRGPFSGDGFDAMWTDMSEIVRPTRDGIHGREYISTVIDLGRKPFHLEFESDKLITSLSSLIEIPSPVVLKIPDRKFVSSFTKKAFAKAACDLQTLVLMRLDDAKEFSDHQKSSVMVLFDSQKDQIAQLKGCRAVELPYQKGLLQLIQSIKLQCPDIVVSVKIPLDEHAVSRAKELAHEQGEVLHFCADTHGLCADGRFVTECIREIHEHLVDASLRDQVTLLVSGGLAMAEHVAKIIACGADGAVLDQAPLVALECRLCRDCDSCEVCPVQIDKVDEGWGAQRIVNLMDAWHSQLIELMGAMGIREVRRLRGELGRVMFFEDLERENFSPLFGKRTQESKAYSQQFDIEVALNKDLVDPIPSRFRNKNGKYRVVRTSSCIQCGACVQVCDFKVFEHAGPRMATPQSHLCVGLEACEKQGQSCVKACPQDALREGENPAWAAFGDCRWTPDLMWSTWHQGETGMPPKQGYEYKIGASGGGCDRIEIVFDQKMKKALNSQVDIDLSVKLRRQQSDRLPDVSIGIPFYGGGMSYGSIGLTTMLARARAYQKFDSFTCTGEGGFPQELEAYKDHVITQVATGLFGVKESTIKQVRFVEFKYAQGAKPGLGGHLLGEKVTAVAANIRESVEGVSLFSPFPFHSVYSIEDHKKHVDWIKAINPEAIVSVKVSGASDVDMVAVGSYYAGADIIHLDGSYGGTGAAPDIAKKNIAMPIEYAVPKVHRFLTNEGIRDKITIIASGGLRSAWDMAKVIALGADGVVIGTSELVALECVRCGICERGRGCPRGIATTDPELVDLFACDWATQRLVNLFSSYVEQLKGILRGLGMRSIGELVGRTDVLRHLDYSNSSSLFSSPPL